jgi:hypothetical protein
VTDGSHARQRTSRRSSGACRFSGTAGVSGAERQQHRRSADGFVQHDVRPAAALEQQQPHWHCFLRHVSCFVSQEPATGAIPETAHAAIRRAEIRILAEEGNTAIPPIESLHHSSILVEPLPVKAGFP